MRFDTLLDSHTDVTESPGTRDLLVLWQHPDTREIIPIGRLSHVGDTYRFVYTRGAASIQNFRLLPGLESLHQAYLGERLPPVFDQRVMEPDRPDYAEYLRTLGLDPSRATPWEQILHSGGTRAGDTLQFMQVPTVRDGRVRARFLANGVRHMPEHARNVGGRSIRVSKVQHEQALRALSPGASVSVVPEADNPEDDYATLIMSYGIPLGYVPRFLSRSVRELLESGPVSLTVVRVGEPDTPPHLRLVLDLDIEAPPGFTFDRDNRWDALTQ
jgi:hypothetical protein